MTHPTGVRVGSRVGPYEVLSFVGAGGMGEVYRAHDTRLSRDVALKVLPALFSTDPNRLRRFEQEARAGGSLNHPNVLTVHDVGSEAGIPYVVSELLEGETLRSRLRLGVLPVRKALELARDICEGLAAAHDKGLVHRDLKPENIFITRQGHAKILDFGLAKLKTASTCEEATGAVFEAATASQTQTGVLIGTVGYMSPEQIRGDELDGRSDIFSLGSVLYEMLSGGRSFGRATSAETMHAILNEDPRPLDRRVGAGIERVVRRCLEKRAEERFQSAHDVAFALEAVSGSSGESLVPERRTRMPRPWMFALALAIGLAGYLALRLTPAFAPRGPDSSGGEAAKSVAVLPFQPRGTVTGHEYLGFALPDEIATLLTYAPGLAVRPLTDSSRFTGEGVDLARVGGELGVQHLVAGNFSQEGESLRFSVEAIELASKRVLWRDTWTVAPTDLRSLRATIRERVSAGLLPALGQPRTLLSGAGRGPADGEGYELYLRACALTWDTAPNKEAMRLLERATALDPEFAPAWYELANRSRRDAAFSDGGGASLARSGLATERAVALDPDLLPAVTLRITLDANDGRVPQAYRAAEDLLARRPSSSKAHFARSYALRYGGAMADAARECRLARALDPSDPELWRCYWTFTHLRAYEQAESFAELARQRQPELHAAVLADIWTRKGDRDGARRSMVNVPDEVMGADVQRACLQAPRPAGIADLVKRDLARLHTYAYDSEGRYWYAALVADCGFEDAAFRFLSSSIESGYCSSVALDNDPLWDRIRERPRFRELREQARRCRDRFIAETGVAG